LTLEEYKKQQQKPLTPEEKEEIKRLMKEAGFDNFEFEE
jgi:hypothetical protein